MNQNKDYYSLKFVNCKIIKFYLFKIQIQMNETFYFLFYPSLIINNFLRFFKNYH